MDLIHTVYEPAGAGPHPTIIAMHGWGASALDLMSNIFGMQPRGADVTPNKRNIALLCAVERDLVGLTPAEAVELHAYVDDLEKAIVAFEVLLASRNGIAVDEHRAIAMAHQAIQKVLVSR